MKERPILFSAQMVLAILAGAKTQTRRVMKPQPRRVDGGVPYGDAPAWAHAEQGSMMMRCPYGKRGDKLWVRETHAFTDLADGTPVVAYAADKSQIAIGRAAPDSADYLIHDFKFADEVHVDRWKPSIHTPRWASRITLEITGVRAERLQEISEVNAIAEGCGIHKPFSDHWQHRDVAKEEYRCLWETLHPKIGETWGHNPWVWVVEFKRLEGGAA